MKKIFLSLIISVFTLQTTNTADTLHAKEITPKNKSVAQNLINSVKKNKKSILGGIAGITCGATIMYYGLLGRYVILLPHEAAKNINTANKLMKAELHYIKEALEKETDSQKRALYENRVKTLENNIKAFESVSKNSVFGTF